MAKTDKAALENYEPPIWITCWIDYSSKYGVGYTLSNGVHGVYFNDCTKMLLHPDKTLFYNFFILKFAEIGFLILEKDIH